MYAAGREAGTVSTGVSASKIRKRLELFALILTLVLLTVVCLGQNAMKLFWYDELVTLRIAGLHTIGDILRFYQAGKDTTSYLPAMLVHAFQAIPVRPEVTTRIPFTFAYLVTCLCLWLFMHRRYPVGYAMGAVFLFAQGWSLYFASEIRAYAFVMMGASIAMGCWSAAGDRGRWRSLATFGVFAGLAIAILFHFFAVFLLVPFLVAELYYRQTTGFTRWGMWAGILLYPAAIAVMLPNMLAARTIYGKNFWSKPTIGLLTDNYVIFTVPLARDLAEMAVFVLVVQWYLRRAEPVASDDRSRGTGFSRAEWVLLLGICLIPFVAFAGAKVLGVYRTQYLLYFQVGTMLLIVGALAEVLHRRTDAGWGFAVLMLLMFLVHERDRFTQGLRAIAGKSVSQLPSEYEVDWVKYLQGTHLPIVAEGSNTLMIVQQYAPEIKDRVIILTSHERATAYPTSLTNELNMEIFRQDLNLPVEDYDKFVAGHHDFLLLANPEQFPFTWMFHSLVDESQKQRDVSVRLLRGSD